MQIYVDADDREVDLDPYDEYSGEDSKEFPLLIATLAFNPFGWADCD